MSSNQSVIIIKPTVVSHTSNHLQAYHDAHYTIEPSKNVFLYESWFPYLHFFLNYEAGRIYTVPGKEGMHFPIEIELIIFCVTLNMLSKHATYHVVVPVCGSLHDWLASFQRVPDVFVVQCRHVASPKVLPPLNASMSDSHFGWQCYSVVPRSLANVISFTSASVALL